MGYRRRRGMAYRDGKKIEDVRYEWTAPDGTVFRANDPTILDRRKKLYEKVR